jgi:hypothetical protein
MRLNASWFNGDARVHLRVRYEYMTERSSFFEEDASPANGVSGSAPVPDDRDMDGEVAVRRSPEQSALHSEATL